MKKGGEGKLGFLKKVVLILALLTFGSGVLFASIWQISAQTASENFKVAPVATSSNETEESTEGVDYILPWPGILPDHFLYPVKMARDRLWLWLTTDPLKKTELLLKYADKRIWAAQILIEKGREDLAVTTATKAEKYLEEAINQEEVARKKGKDTAVLLETLSKATLKHEEVLIEVKNKAGETAQPVIDSALEYARRGHEQVMQTLEE